MSPSAPRSSSRTLLLLGCGCAIVAAIVLAIAGAIGAALYFAGAPTPGLSPHPTTIDDQWASNARSVEDFDGTLRLKEGEEVVLEVGRTHGSVGIWQELTRTPDASIASVEMRTVPDNPGNTMPGGDSESTYLVVKGAKPGRTTFRVVECFRAEPNPDGSCNGPDDKPSENNHTIDVEVTK